MTGPASPAPLASDVARASPPALEMSAVRRVMGAGFDPQGCADFLRARHPIKPAQAVASRTGDPVRTVERWLAGSTPTLKAFIRLTLAYGPGFVAAAVPGLTWARQAAALASYENLAVEIERLEARRAALKRSLFGEGRSR